MENIPERTGTPEVEEVEIESKHLLQAVDRRNAWLAGELDGGYARPPSGPEF